MEDDPWIPVISEDPRGSCRGKSFLGLASSDARPAMQACHGRFHDDR